ncbi:hypothetical protein V6259_12935 [Marinomonas sp. TI.3.20]|uniref:hypothetical protein n=1 Tax=Marinomonas sp. TI.3.20 TaxID=3121296 RepID=UPI00311D8621
MPAFYSWLKANKEETKKHISYGGTTMCGHEIPARHTYNVYGYTDVCLRCQKGYVAGMKEKYGDEWKDYINTMYVPDLELDLGRD